MSEIDLPAKSDRPQRIDQNNLPKIGEWFWVTCDDWDEVTHWVNGVAKGGRGKKTREVLMCVAHLASNHVKFKCTSPGGGTSEERVRYRELLALTRPEPKWKEIIQTKIVGKQAELQQAIMAMADSVRQADLLPKETQASDSLLPSTTRFAPEDSKRRLIKLRDKTFPAAQRDVEQITQEMVALHKGLVLPMLIEGKRMAKAVEGVEDRLFVLELYAGICEEAKCIREGEAAAEETPVVIRQMLRYMDEECLIDYDKGGMNYERLADFDAWVAKPEHFKRLCPEPRCVVALKVRRHDKDYGRPLTMGHAFQIVKMQQADAATYLLIRNGEQLWRLATEIEFAPRLIPLRGSFERPLEKKDQYNFEKMDYDIEPVDPDHLDYDEIMGKRKREVFKHNRVLFLIQGLFDRSKVFSPHPPVDLSSHEGAVRWLKIVFDEETGLPSANPPVWEVYRDRLNAKIKVGQIVRCALPMEKSGRYTRDKHYPKYGYDAAARPLFCKVASIAKDRKTLVLRWELGDRITSEWVLDMARPVPNKPGWYYRKKVDTNHGMRWGQQRVPMDKVFNVLGYKIGDYKPFLCDAYLKGAYLQWAPALLDSERYLLEQAGRWNPKVKRPISRAEVDDEEE
jgi:hypothetical protein